MARWPFLAMALLIVLGPGCMSADTQYYREGIGTTLADPGAVAQAQDQDQYFGYLCRQAGAQDDRCAVDWKAFTEAGMNDIDQRCDSYLAWLDDRRRSITPVLQEIGDAETATHALLFATSAGSSAMGIAAAAFGFARDSFNNVNSRLLFEVNHSTVQAIVLNNQTRLRAELRGQSIANRPQAVYVLRQYLRVCMPFTIETEINNTITAFAAGGAGALAPENRQALVSTEISNPEAVPTAPPMRSRIIATQPLPAQNPVGPRAPVAPRAPPGNPRGPADPFAALLADPSDAASKAQLDRVLSALCAPAPGAHPEGAKARIKAFQQYQRKFAGDTVASATGRLTAAEIAAAASEPACDRSQFQNFYEKTVFSVHALTDPDLVAILNKGLAAGRQLAPNATQEQIRGRIPEIRASLRDKLVLNDPALDDQLTLDLLTALEGGDTHGL